MTWLDAYNARAAAWLAISDLKQPRNGETAIARQFKSLAANLALTVGYLALHKAA